MNKLLILLLFIFNSFLYGCALCTLAVPKVDVYTTIYAKKDFTTFDVTWKFHTAFSEALKPYDVNENGIYEKAEKEAILEALIVYIKPIHYLTNIEYIKKDTEFEEYFYEPIITNFERITFSETNQMIFNYNFEIPITLQKDYKLALNYYDGGGNFDFILKDIILKDYNGFKAIVPKFAQTYVYFFKEYQNQAEQFYQQEYLPPILQTGKNQQVELEPIQEEQDLSLLDILSEELTKLKLQIEATLLDIQENNSLSAYFWLLLFSFIYGILHAIGPGHGKSLVSSYFIHQNKSYVKAFSIASLIGITHTFSAFLLTLIIYNIIGLMFNSSLVDIEQMATKVSAFIIISIAFYLIYKKYKKASTQITFNIGSTPSFVYNQPTLHKPTSDCGCSGCKTTSTDLGVILAAGIVPCPGTVTIFLFTISLGIYLVGFVSAIFMSIGMSLVIYITAILSLKVRKSTSSNETIVKILEYGSLVFILFLGLILLIL